MGIVKLPGDWTRASRETNLSVRVTPGATKGRRESMAKREAEVLTEGVKRKGPAELGMEPGKCRHSGAIERRRKKIGIELCT